jgi:cysteine sulfinate desulfinase/cysteine desulfurase-like protein
MSIFLNNNYTKLTSKKILDEINKWSSLIENKQDININDIIDKYKLYIYNYFGVTNNKYEIYITNGYKSYNIIYNLIPLYYNTKIHIIISNTEETITSNHYKTLLDNKKIEITLINPNNYGNIEIENIKKLTKKNTKFIIMPYSNKELGTINNIKDIYAYCKSNDIILFSNINYLFGYNTIKYVNNIDLIFATFDNIYGPSNIGILLIKKKLINDNISQYIKKSNFILTKNKDLPIISGSLHSLLNILKSRDEKNNKIKTLKSNFIDKLYQVLPVLKYKEYKNLYTQSIIKLTVVIINDNFIDKTNTLFLSIFSNKIKINSNNIKKYLDKNNIIINDLSSNIINTIEYDTRIKNGLISISFGDHNKQTDINNLFKILIEAIYLQYNTIYEEIKDNIIVNKKASQKKIKKVVRFSNPICIESKTKIHNYPNMKSILIT